MNLGGSLGVDGGVLKPPTGGGGSGAVAVDGGRIQLSGTAIQGLGLGVYVAAGGFVRMDNGVIENGTGDAIITNGELVLTNTIVRNNALFGVGVGYGRASITGGEVSNNQLGVNARGAVVLIENTSVK